MAINKKLIHFNKYSDFLKELEAGNILEKSIVYIKDKGVIYTHSKGYQSIPSGGSEGQILGIKDGEVVWIDNVAMKSDLPEEYDDTAIKNRLSSLESIDHSKYITDISNKVDKVSGKGLSTNDYTDADKTKLDGVDARFNAITASLNNIDTILDNINGESL